jgi:pimeloyl-ACP methyl ester carboxylesterase
MDGKGHSLPEKFPEFLAVAALDDIVAQSRLWAQFVAGWNNYSQSLQMRKKFAKVFSEELAHYSKGEPVSTPFEFGFKLSQAIKKSEAAAAAGFISGALARPFYESQIDAAHNGSAILESLEPGALPVLIIRGEYSEIAKRPMFRIFQIGEKLLISGRPAQLVALNKGPSVEFNRIAVRWLDVLETEAPSTQEISTKDLNFSQIPTKD